MSKAGQEWDAFVERRMAEHRAWQSQEADRLGREILVELDPNEFRRRSSGQRRWHPGSRAMKQRIHFRLDEASIAYLEAYMREHGMPSMNSALNRALKQMAKQSPLPTRGPQPAHK